jgi:hypothetical protein
VSRREQEPTITLARDEFTVERRRLEGHPEAVRYSSRQDVADAYGNVTTWVIDQYRLEGEIIALVQVVSASGGIRLVLPANVTRTIAAGQMTLATKHRRKVAKRVVADRRARGEKVGNPEALAKARRRKK